MEELCTMKKLTCLLLSLLVTLAMLTSCDLSAPLDFIKSVIPSSEKTEADVTTATPEITSTEPEITSTEPEITSTEPEITTAEPEGTSAEPEGTTNQPEGITTQPEVIPPEPEINYGTLNTPVTTTYAHSVCANFANNESSANPFYVKGKVTKIGETGGYYKNVYFTDGTTEMLIYTINMGDGISGFKVGDTITAYGYIKNYNGTIEMATYNGSVYVYVVKVEAANPDQGDDPIEHLYTDFTDEEKKLFNDIVGLVIPFIPNNGYQATKYELDTFGENCVHFYTIGNTQAEFEAYLELFSSYNFDDTFEDQYGDLWYYYSSGNINIDVTYYFYNDNYILDVYVYLVTEDEGDTDPSDYLYTEFTEEDKALFNETVDFVIPFLPNDQYYVEEYQTWNESGVVFYTIGNTEEEFNAYLTLFNTYSFIGSKVDEYGDTWHHYSNGEAFIRLAYYIYEEAPYAIVEVYFITSDWTEEEWDDPSIELLPNDGKGLPEDADGIYDVDFTEGEYVQDVSDQKYYADGCPPTGNPAVLVIPVEFSDITAQSKGYTIDKIEQIFYGNNLSYYSLHEYFRISSQNQLDLDITVVDTWFRPANSSSYYKEMSASHTNEEEQQMGTQLILNEALAYLATFMDLSKFDSDNNGYIDAVVLVNTVEIDGKDDFHWAYRYQNWYKDEGGAPYKYDDVSANDYVWISYQFMFEAYDEDGYMFFDPSNPLNPYTFIHEFSHILGADDYYDTAGETTLLDGLDVMDSTMGDHNPYTKFNYGWITTSKLIVTDSSVTINLEAFAKDGDTIILANNWDEALGAYQEYYIIMYYTMTGLNAGDGGYFDQNAILVYHINATLQIEYDDQKSPYIVYNNNTSVGPNSTKNNLIEYVVSGDDDYIYTVGEALPTTTDDSGNELIYTFIVDALTEEYATITFTKK